MSSVQSPASSPRPPRSSTSRYQELCSTLEKTRHEWRSFKSECVRHGDRLVQGFVHYLGVPEKRWHVLPPDVTAETAMLPYDTASAMRLTDDGHWLFLLQIDLLAPGGEFPTLQPMIFPVKVGKRDPQSETFEVCLADKTCRSMHDALPSEFTELFESAYRLIEEELDSQLESFLEDSPTLNPRRIGFV